MARFRRRETIFSQGDPAKNVMFIQEGEGEAYGGQYVWQRSRCGDSWGQAILYGEGCLAGQSVYTTTATAIAPASILVIEKHEMIHVLHEEHEFSDRFIAYMLARNIRVEERPDRSAL